MHSTPKTASQGGQPDRLPIHTDLEPFGDQRCRFTGHRMLASADSHDNESLRDRYSDITYGHNDLNNRCLLRISKTIVCAGNYTAAILTASSGDVS